ncbi:hypothetical protein CFBP4996_26545 (plasmid) [Agrobacterium leguminum]|uniref:hypothetical protein n=1 Tax=Agrobacterium leguminum TaxID=2792015 RepID=UPI0014850DEB|nr:hypothetical protein [Agrobacterium leguminum]WFS69554.1 hypothetical protein CFBP4996_26545 [Agrobacterium leguminum]
MTKVEMYPFPSNGQPNAMIVARPGTGKSRYFGGMPVERPISLATKKPGDGVEPE